MLRVFHVPSHLSYASKLSSDRFTPVSSPFGDPLRVADLLALASWDFFDVLHLHTVELASPAELASLTERLKRAGKGLVFTMHDLEPNIEADLDTFRSKVQLVASAGPRIVTLTQAAAEHIPCWFGYKASVIPHGFAVPPTVATSVSPVIDHLLVFGALRPNRDFLGVVRAWRLLAEGRPSLHLLLRSVGPRDKQRYAAELTELDRIASSEPGLVIEMVDHMLSSTELAKRCRASLLVLPYHHITHSGQLELARDLGLPVGAPDVPTVHAQLTETSGEDHPCTWFPARALRDPREFAPYLEKALLLTQAPMSSGARFSNYRMVEHNRIIDLYGSQYQSSINRR